MLVLGVLVILALTATSAKIGAGLVISSARTSGRRTVCFAMAADHLNDGLRSWKGICHRWFQLAIGVFVVPIFQGIQLKFLQSNTDLSPHSGLDMDSQDMLPQSSKSRR